MLTNPTISKPKEENYSFFFVTKAPKAYTEFININKFRIKANNSDSNSKSPYAHMRGEYHPPAVQIQKMEFSCFLKLISIYIIRSVCLELGGWMLKCGDREAEAGEDEMK